jgi:DNA-binding HxlR family transcriptional regulator
MPRETYECSLAAARAAVSGKWKPSILWALEESGPRRFGQLRRDVDGITEKVLSQQLKEMEAHGLVVRTCYDEVPPRVEYSLTEQGASLLRILHDLSLWGREHLGHLVESEENDNRCR